MKSQLRDAQRASTEMDTHLPRTTTGIDFDHGVTQLQELNETIVILENGVKILNKDTQRLTNESLEQQIKLHYLMTSFSKVHLANTRNEVSLEETRSNGEILKQELVSMTKKFDDIQYLSHDGTLI
jgi:ABC-type uncharacterized transport system ATPase subunit